MATSDRSHARFARTDRPGVGPQLLFGAIVIALFGSLAVLAITSQRDLAFALLSIGLFAAAGVIALAAWVSRKPNPHALPSYWDVAGALTLIGIFVAAFVDPDQLALAITSVADER